MPEIVKTERIIPRFVADSVTENSALHNKWVYEPFKGYVYCEEVKLTYDDGETETRRVDAKCQPTRTNFMYQVNDKGEKDGLFVAFLEDGRLHWITTYKNGKCVEHHCIVQQHADSLRMQSIDMHGLVFMKAWQQPKDGLILTCDKKGKPYLRKEGEIREVAYVKDGEDVWRHPITQTQHTEAQQPCAESSAS